MKRHAYTGGKPKLNWFDFLRHFQQHNSGADLGFFILQSKKNFGQGVVSAGRGGRRGWLNNFNADSPYIKFDSTFEAMTVLPNIRAHQHA